MTDKYTADRYAEANAYYQASLHRVKTIPEPEGQKFPIGARVKIAEKLGPSMSHFPSGCNATVEHTYAHAYGGDGIKSYSLNIDGLGSVAWYDESQLTLIETKEIK